MQLAGSVNKILLFGGNAALGDHLADLWKWTGEQWKPVTTDTVPEGRFAAGLAYHNASRSTVLFGSNANVFLDDTWLLNTQPLIETRISLTVDGRGVNRTLTARLFRADDPAIGIEGRTVAFFADGNDVGAAITDANGGASIGAPPRYRGGKHDFEAHFEGDDYYSASSDRQTPL